MNKMTDGHISSRYDGELNHLHGLVLNISEVGREQLRAAVGTLDDEDVDEARKVIHRDQVINEMEVQADNEIVRLIAKRQPVARDLREILTVAKIVTDLERVGDEARKIAMLTLHFYDNDTPPPAHNILRDIHKMAAYVDEMVGIAMRAFDELDLELATEAIRRDLELDEDFKSALRRLSTFMMEDPRSVGYITEVVLGLRALERIGGHAKNIGGHVVFLIKGKDVRHEELAIVEAEVRG